MHHQVSVIEARYIIDTLRKHCHTDLGFYSMGHLRCLLSGFIAEKRMKYPDILVQRLMDYPDLMDELLYVLDQPASEMFRDPEIWCALRRQIVPALKEKWGSIRAWLPCCSSGEDLFSLHIVLYETGMLIHTTTHAETFSSLRLKQARLGRVSSRMVQQSRTNYHQACPAADFDRYVHHAETHWTIEGFLVNSAAFSSGDAIPPVPKEKTNLILFRNKLLYMHPNAARDMLKVLCESLKPGGFLVLGYLDLVPDSGSCRLQPVSEIPGAYERI